MTALVVYESMFGSTRDVAAAVADAIGAVMPVHLVEVGAAPRQLDVDCRLLVVGGPTHAFGMSRTSTRRSAAEQAPHGLVSRGEGIREWIEALRAPDHPVDVATFDTRVNRPRVPGSAASAALRRLRHLGLRPVLEPETFWVTGMTDPISLAEVDRARDWGRAVTTAVTAPA